MKIWLRTLRRALRNIRVRFNFPGNMYVRVRLQV
jgi:hypothetical protein